MASHWHSAATSPMGEVSHLAHWASRVHKSNIANESASYSSGYGTCYWPIFGQYCFQTCRFIIGRFLRKSDYIVFTSVGFYWPIFGQYCFQTCQFIYLFIIGQFRTILFSDVSVYLFLLADFRTILFSDVSVYLFIFF